MTVFIATLKVMVEAATAEAADAAITQLLDGEPVLDSSIESVDQAADELVDAITNETYCEGDFTQSWVVFSPSTEEQFGLGYYSTTYGCVTRDLATRFDPFKRHTESGMPEDVVLLSDKLQ